MGYTTEFEGVLNFTCEMTAEKLAYLNTMLGIDIRDWPAFFKQSAQLSYIQYELTNDFTGIKWDGGEKFYYAENACNFIIENMQERFPEFGLSGELLAQGEELGDVWKLIIKEGKAVKIPIDVIGLVECPDCGHKFKLGEDK